MQVHLLEYWRNMIYCHWKLHEQIWIHFLFLILNVKHHLERLSTFAIWQTSWILTKTTRSNRRGQHCFHPLFSVNTINSVWKFHSCPFGDEFVTFIDLTSTTPWPYLRFLLIQQPSLSLGILEIVLEFSNPQSLLHMWIMKKEKEKSIYLDKAHT